MPWDAYYRIGSDPKTFTGGRFRSQSPHEQVAAALSRAPLWVPDAGDPMGEERWGYSNTNYVLAGLLIERVTGNPWVQQIHERLILPLGLRNTLVPGSSAYVPQPTVTAYTEFSDSAALTDTTVASGGGADGGIISTPGFSPESLGADELPVASGPRRRAGRHPREDSDDHTVPGPEAVAARLKRDL
ncbi:serine hydrolase [Streptomyces sp. NPDC056500]|uniref:serine hydrolase n=1 Tax=Streptomyces sp. NPDC056500 TaxID=3345840 RepID=UPI0036AD6EA5